MHAYANTGASSTNIMFLKLGVDGTRSGRAHQRCHHCRWLLRAIIEPQMEHVKVASGGRDGRRLAWLLPLGSLLMGPLVFKRGFSTKKNRTNTALAENYLKVVVDRIFYFVYHENNEIPYQCQTLYVAKLPKMCFWKRELRRRNQQSVKEPQKESTKCFIKTSK